MPSPSWPETKSVDSAAVHGSPEPALAAPENATGVPAPAATQRVLHVINGEHYAGAERVQDLLALRLPAHGFAAGFVAIKAGRFGDVRKSVNADLIEAPMAGRWDLNVARLVARVARQGDYALLHAHTPRSGLVAALAARRTVLPFVYHVHSPTSRDSTHRVRNWINDQVERWVVRSAERLITVSPTLTDHMCEMGVAENRINCVFNGVPSIAGAAPRTSPPSAWTLGMVALFRPRKGAEVLLEALAAVRSQGRDVRLRMIGPFETEQYESELLECARRLQVADAVHWTGFTEDVAGELARVDALALPSLFGEGLPMVVLEAMAAGLPVVATDCEGVAQAVVDRQTGLLIDPGDPRKLADAIELLVSGQLDYAALSAGSLARHAAEFSDDIMARRVADVYRDVLTK